jgi:hypothetical protein
MRSLDLFSWKKIIAPDFFENTLPGAWLSISAAVVMGVLFVAELTSYLSVKVTSEVVMTSYVATGRSPPPPSPRSPSLDRRWPLLAPAACMSTWPRPVGVCMRLGDPLGYPLRLRSRGAGRGGLGLGRRFFFVCG